MIDDYSFDIGDIASEMRGIDWGSIGGSNFGSSGFDLGSFEDLAAVRDLGNLDFGSIADLGSFEDLAAVDALKDFGSGFDLGSFEDLAAVDALKDFGSAGFDLGGFEDLDEAARLERLASYGVQNLVPTSPTITDEGLLDIGGYNRPGGYTSQWQTTPSGERVFLYDESGYYDGKPVDQTGIGVRTGADGRIDVDKGVRALTTSQIQDMIRRGELNTAKSGYFEATGGSKVAPGGGITTTKDGKTYTLKPDGNVYDTNTGKTVTDTKTIREIIDQIRNTGGSGNVSTRPGTQGNLLGSLLPLLLLMMAMRDKQGGGTTSNAVIPALTATQRQTPYTQIQQAPGYRPGQGGITYFNPVQYAPRMAAGGIADLARGRLLDGKGDGVSDDIPAVIGTDQPARLARGEYVVDARTVAELGNGSTDAGAERLDEMRRRVHAKRKKAKVGQDSKAYKALPA